MSDFDQLVSRVEDAPKPGVDVPLLLDPEAAARHRELEAELEKVRTSPGDSIGQRGAAEVAQDIADLYEAASPTVFRFVPVSPKQWSDLGAKHAPKKGQRGDVDPDSFWPEAMAACCAQPEGATVDGFVRLRDSLSNGQWQLLIQGCRQANDGVHDIRPSLTASAILRASKLSSATAPPEGSPEASS